MKPDRRRLLVVFVVFGAFVHLVLSVPALAAGGRKPTDDMLDIAVMPFVAVGGEAQEAKEALELELELVETARVQSSEALQTELNDLDGDPFAPDALAVVMKRRGIEVLVATPEGLSKRVVVAFAADGRARLVKELPRGAGADQLAATTMAALKPLLSKWSKAKPVALPEPTPTKKRARMDDDVTGESGVVPEPGRKKKDAKSPKAARKSTTPEKPGRDENESGSRKKTPRLDDEQDQEESSNGSDNKRWAQAEDPSAAPSAAADARAGDDRRSPIDTDAPTSPSSSTKGTHVLALAGAFAGSTWNYRFETQGAAPSPVTASFYPGAAVRFDLWPLDFVGFDADASVANVQFQIRSSGEGAGRGVAITPNQFASTQVNAGASLRGRWLLRFSDQGALRLVGLGGRLGYRLWQASVEPQVITGTQTKLTVVPGFQFHGLTVGPEVYLPLFVADRRFEFELKVDTLPLTFYGESPDNPGASSLAFGYHAELIARFEVLGGFFVELAGRSTGATIEFEGTGDRVTTIPGNDQPIVLSGGQAQNSTMGFTAGLGFFW
jgi:hypothetical protein